MLSTAEGILFALLLVAGVPALSLLTARARDLRAVPRLDLYLSALLSQWLLAALGVIVVITSSAGFSATGFRAVSPSAFLLWTLWVAGTALAGLGLLMFLERFGWWPPEAPLVRLLIPESLQEKLWAALMVAPTAAFCEEFLYRGYLLFQLSQWFHSMPWAWAGSSAAFGLAHGYQGFAGMLRAGALGALLAYPVVRLGTLYPSMAAHFLIDAVALAWLGPKFLKSQART